MERRNFKIWLIQIILLLVIACLCSINFVLTDLEIKNLKINWNLIILNVK